MMPTAQSVLPGKTWSAPHASDESYPASAGRERTGKFSALEGAGGTECFSRKQRRVGSNLRPPFIRAKPFLAR